MKPFHALALAAAFVAAPAPADPPRHAPAHGHVKHAKPPKHPAGHYPGRSGVVYVHDYGISAGRCNRDEIGAVIGAVVGHAIGDSMDEKDRACMGHALELGRPGVPVAWRHGGHHYHFTPRADARDGCRFATLVVDGGRPKNVLACPSGRGAWTFRRG